MVEATDYTDLITSEFADSPNFVAMVAYSVQAFVDNMNLLANMYLLFDVDIARGDQQDKIGQIVGVSRFLKTPLKDVYFSFDLPNLGWDQGVWQGPYDPNTGITVLDDEHYRILLKAKIIANFWDGTIEGAYDAWNILFEPEGYTIIIQDGLAGQIPYLSFNDPNVLYGWDYAGWAPAVDPGYHITGGMNIIMGLIAPYRPPLPPLVRFTFDGTAAEGWDAGYWDITPEPFLAPNIDAVTLALFQGGYLSLKPGGVGITEYAVQSVAGAPMFGFDVGPANSEGVQAPPTLLAGWDIGAWAVIAHPITAPYYEPT